VASSPTGGARPEDAQEEKRKDALSSYLEERVAEGFRIETRTDTHAIIVPAREGRSFLDRFRKQRVPAREVISVDVDGNVTASPAEPLRS
jgi:hypothetical protein